MPNNNIEKRRATWRKHYRKNPEKYLERNKIKRQELRDWFRNLKDRLACKHCGEDHPACIVFHHRNPSEKDFTIGNCINRNFSKKRILAEIAKCEVLCSNCHLKHHWRCGDSNAYKSYASTKIAKP